MTDMVSKHFAMAELRCPCGNCEPIVDQEFVTKLEGLRIAFGEPMPVTSWFRCPDRNREVGGAPSSQHLQGRAVDVSTNGWGADKAFRLLRGGRDFGFRGVGIYEKHVHLDQRTAGNSIWIGESN